MCEKPITLPNGQKIACRKCNACIAVRKWDWIARAMGETAVMPWGGVLNLTYDESAAASDGKRVFRYHDVQTLMKSLRNEALSVTGEQHVVRYLVAGERGSRRGRVHYHILLWGSVNLFKIGRWSDFHAQYKRGFLPSDGPQEFAKCEPEFRKRLVWDRWRFGHVMLDALDRGSAEYVLKYALKEQFNAKNSKGTRRETRAEVTGASLFRMSKDPPVGYLYLQAVIGRWLSLGHVAPDALVTIPGMRGKWYPRGTMREVLERGLALCFVESMEQSGKPPHGWNALWAKMSQTEPGLAFLENIAEWINDEGPEAKEDPAGEVGRPSERDRHRSRCDRVYPCQACYASLSPQERKSAYLYALKSRYRYHAWKARNDHRRQSGQIYSPSVGWDEWQIAQGEKNPGCQRGYGEPFHFGHDATPAEQTYFRDASRAHAKGVQRPAGQSKGSEG